MNNNKITINVTQILFVEDLVNMLGTDFMYQTRNEILVSAPFEKLTLREAPLVITKKMEKARESLFSQFGFLRKKQVSHDSNYFGVNFIYKFVDEVIELSIPSYAPIQNVGLLCELTTRICAYLNVTEYGYNGTVYPVKEANNVAKQIESRTIDALIELLSNDEDTLLLGYLFPFTLSIEQKKQLMKVDKEMLLYEFESLIIKMQNEDAYFSMPNISRYLRKSTKSYCFYGVLRTSHTIIPKKANYCNNPNFEFPDNIDRWEVSLFEFKLGESEPTIYGYVDYTFFLTNLKEEYITEYDKNYFLIKPLPNSEINKLFKMMNDSNNS